jgi:hypothetical protein
MQGVVHAETRKPNLPILYRKKLLVVADYPRRDKLARVTRQELRHGLYREPESALGHLGDESKCSRFAASVGVGTASYRSRNRRSSSLGLSASESVAPQSIALSGPPSSRPRRTRGSRVVPSRLHTYSISAIQELGSCTDPFCRGRFVPTFHGRRCRIRPTDD